MTKPPVTVDNAAGPIAVSHDETQDPTYVPSDVSSESAFNF